MRLKDSYAFSLHTIKENKSRSILTVAISAFLSLLIMGLMCIVISFLKNGTSILNKVFYENAIVTVDYQNDQGRSEKEYHDVMNKTYHDVFNTIIEENNDVVSYVIYTSNLYENSYGSSYANMNFTEPKYPISTGIDIIEGRNITPKGEGEIKEVIVSQAYYNSTLNTSNPYKVDSIHEDMISLTYIDEHGVTKVAPVTIKYKVVGIYVYSDELYIVNGSETTAFESGVKMIGDVNIAYEPNNNYVYMRNATVYYKNSIENVNPNALTSKLNHLTDEMNEKLPKRAVLVTKKGGLSMVSLREASSFRAGQTYESQKIYRYVFLGAAGFISIVLLLMSVGSLANSVNISIDSSKKFIGLLKALGVRGRALRRIITMESATLIAVGLLIAFGLLFALEGPLGSIVTALTTSMYGSYITLTGYVCKYYVPIYVLLGALVLFVGLTLLFARGSLRKIAKTDPMAVISEVS